MVNGFPLAPTLGYTGCPEGNREIALDHRTTTAASDVRTDTPWPDRIHAHFKRVGVRQVGYVPDTGHARLIKLCQEDPEIIDVVLTSEAEGAGLVAGAALGGQRAALLMQSSGVGNCINMFSLLQNCGFPCLVLVTMRGEFADFNPWQVPMGTATPSVLTATGVHVRRADVPDDAAEIVAASAALAFDSAVSVAVLFSQRLIGAKVFAK